MPLPRRHLYFSQKFHTTYSNKMAKYANLAAQKFILSSWSFRELGGIFNGNKGNFTFWNGSYSFISYHIMKIFEGYMVTVRPVTSVTWFVLLQKRHRNNVGNDLSSRFFLLFTVCLRLLTSIAPFFDIKQRIFIHKTLRDANGCYLAIRKAPSTRASFPWQGQFVL